MVIGNKLSEIYTHGFENQDKKLLTRLGSSMGKGLVGQIIKKSLVFLNQVWNL